MREKEEQERKRQEEEAAAAATAAAAAKKPLLSVSLSKGAANLPQRPAATLPSAEEELETSHREEERPVQLDNQQVW